MRLDFWRWGLVVAAPLLLSACDNYVMAKRPWFTLKDAVGVQQVRPGWWVADDPKCRVDPAAFSTTWPDCASPMLVPRNWTGVVRSSDGAEHLLSRGDPMIVQYELVSSPGTAAPLQHVYLYFGLGVLQRDDEGRALALRYWPVLCGPPRRDRPAAMTHRPWPGMLPVRKGGCSARDLVALRRAAELGRVLPVENTGAHWLRDWRSGDKSEADWLADQGIRTH